jgi:hypothetical protein
VEDLKTLFWFSKFLWARERISAKFVEIWARGLRKLLQSLSRRRKRENMDIKDTGCARAWTGLIWLRIGTNGGLFRTRQRKTYFHKMWGTSWVPEKLCSCFMELVRKTVGYTSKLGLSKDARYTKRNAVLGIREGCYFPRGEAKTPVVDAKYSRGFSQHPQASSCIDCKTPSPFQVSLPLSAPH